MHKLILISFLLAKYCQCCDCNIKSTGETNVQGRKRLFINTKPVIDKRQSQDHEYDNNEFLETTGELIEEESQKIKKEELEETQVEVKKTKNKIQNETLESRTMKDEARPNLCPFFKPAPDLNIEKMVDVWRLSFFRSSIELGCFKILLKNLRPETKEFFTEKFGDFNKTVNWDECVLQLTNGRVLPAQEQTHILQKIGNYSGLLSNIIINEEIDHEGNTTLITLQDHSPDQWMVIDNLLLMRDCDNGDIVVFSRVPYEPSQSDINEALEKFGEEVKQGVWACRGQNQAVLNNPRYKILS